MNILLKSLAVIIFLIILAVLALIFLVDPNRFKPRIETLAKDQGIALQINGDLGWNFWPSLGVAVNDVRVAALETPDESIAELQQASLMLRLMPLLRGEFQVDHIAVDGLNLTLAVDESGKGNWEAFTQPKADQPQTQPSQTQTQSAQTQPPADDAASSLTLDVEQISLTNSDLAYTDAQTNQAINLRDINLTMSGVNTRMEPFALDLGFVLEQTQPDSQKLTLTGKVTGQLSMDSALNNFGLSQGQLQLDVAGKESAAIALDYSLNLTDLKGNMAYKGQIELKETNLRKLMAAMGVELDTAKRDALGKFSLSGAVEGNTTSVKLDNLKLTLDETDLTGSAAITSFETSALRATLTGNTFNADDYLPPPSDKEIPADNAPAQDTPLPLDSLRTLNLNIKLGLGKLIVNKIALENIDAKVLAKNGMIEPTLSAIAYKGKITAKGQLDARGQLAQLQFDAGVEGLELEPLLKDMEMDSKFGLQGAVQARALGSGQGNSTNALFNSLRANANFSGAQVRVSPINLEEQFCKLVNLVNQVDDPAQDWEAYTEMTELSGTVKLRDQIITIDSFKAGVEKLQLGTHGKINLATDQYDIFLPFKLVKGKTDTVNQEQIAVTTSANGCSVGSNYWLERGLELLRCRGSFAEINPLSDCRPDKDLLVELTKDYAVYKVKEKHGAKIEEKKQEVQQKIDKEREEAKQKIDEKKSQLLDKLQQRLSRGASSSAAAPVQEAASSAAPAAEPAAPQ